MSKRWPSFPEIVIYEDDELLVLNKPPLLISLDDRYGKEISLLHLLRKAYPGATLCHRLDKETSGVIIAAKNPEAYRHISIQLQKRKVEKIYHAVAEGIHVFNGQKIDLPISVKKTRAIIDRNQGKLASTVITSVENFRHYTLLECQPVTGRYHQIRVHLQSIQAPIAADPPYGGHFPMLSELKHRYHAKETEEQPIMRRVALHAAQISFQNRENVQVTAKADYPADFQTFLKLLRKYDESL